MARVPGHPRATAPPLHPKCHLSGLHKCPSEATQLKIFKPLDLMTSEVHLSADFLC